MREVHYQKTCPFCGKTNARKAGVILKTEPFRKYQKYQCKECAHTFEGELIEGEEL